MSFYATDFIFDDIPGEYYNLVLGELNGGGESQTATSSDVSLLTDKLFRRPIPLYYGTEQQPVLTFPMSIYSPDEIGSDDFSKISSWLFGQMEYKKLRLCQSDLQSVYFNCFLTAPQIVRVGNIVRGFSFTVVCDSPFAWSEPKTYTYTYADANVSDSVTIFNESANNAYTYPTSTVITANVLGGSCTITNISDSSRQFVLTLSPSEVVTINNDLQTISSTVETYPLTNFNLHWLRFIKGYNSLTIAGNISSLVVTSPVAFKIGG